MRRQYATPWQQLTGWHHPTRAEKRGGSNPEVSWNTYPKQGTIPMAPSLLDPRIYSAGRQAPQGSMGSNRPYGNLWQSASQWISRMPALVGR